MDEKMRGKLGSACSRFARERLDEKGVCAELEALAADAGDAEVRSAFDDDGSCHVFDARVANHEAEMVLTGAFKDYRGRISRKSARRMAGSAAAAEMAEPAQSADHVDPQRRERMAHVVNAVFSEHGRPATVPSIVYHDMLLVLVRADDGSLSRAIVEDRIVTSARPI